MMNAYKRFLLSPRWVQVPPLIFDPRFGRSAQTPRLWDHIFWLLLVFPPAHLAQVSGKSSLTFNEQRCLSPAIKYITYWYTWVSHACAFAHVILHVVFFGGALKKEDTLVRNAAVREASKRPHGLEVHFWPPSPHPPIRRPRCLPWKHPPNEPKASSETRRIWVKWGQNSPAKNPDVEGYWIPYCIEFKYIQRISFTFSIFSYSFTIQANGNPSFFSTAGIGTCMAHHINVSPHCLQAAQSSAGHIGIESCA